jgi:hypothetical protein
MKDLQEATETICKLKGENMALLAAIDALLRSLPSEQLNRFTEQHAEASETARVVLLNDPRAGDFVVSSFDLFVRALSTLAHSIPRPIDMRAFDHLDMHSDHFGAPRED